MYLNEYQVLAARTAKIFLAHRDNLEHAVLGIITESGEFATEVKRHVIYDKPLDTVTKAHMVEEAADTLWYVALAATVAGLKLQDTVLEGAFHNLESQLGFEPGLKEAAFLMCSGAVALWASTSEDIGSSELIADSLSLTLGGVQLAAKLLDYPIEEMCKANIEKLMVRFPDKYSNEAAEARADKGGLSALVS